MVMMIMMTISILNYYINNSIYLVLKNGIIITIIIIVNYDGNYKQ